MHDESADPQGSANIRVADLRRPLEDDAQRRIIGQLDDRAAEDSESPPGAGALRRPPRSRAAPCTRCHAPLLIEFGGRWPPLISQEPWRLITAIFLHADPLHLAFNILAIATVGPRIEELYGRWTMLGLFIVTGVLANLTTLQVGSLAVGIGASGGLMGLTGAAAACGHRMGTGHGRAVRDAMLKWLAYTFVYGFMLHADNWAHLFGALSGAAFGFAVKPHLWMRRVLIPARALAGAIGFVAMFAAVLIIFTRTPAPPEEPRERDEELATLPDVAMNRTVDICIKLYGGDSVGAIKAANEQFGDEPDRKTTESILVDVCDALQKMRDDCKDGGPRVTSPEAAPRVRAAYLDACRMYQPAFDRLPVRPHAGQPAPSTEPAGSAR